MGGFKIATIKGIPIRIHYSFLLILPFLAYQFGLLFRAAAQHADVPPDQLQGNPFVWGLVLALALFLSVLIHELAHSLYALRKGGRVRDTSSLASSTCCRHSRWMEGELSAAYWSHAMG